MSLNSRPNSDIDRNSELVCVIDFANYPFIRRFAGHFNEHHSCAYLYHPGFQSPNQGQKDHKPWEYSVDTGKAFAKENLLKRRFQEQEWGRAAAGLLQRLRPGLVVVANAPLEVLRVIQQWCEADGTPFVFWMQDVHSYAIDEALRRRLPVLGAPIIHYYRRLERRLLRASERVLLIADDHRGVLDDLKIPSGHARVLPNWSTIEDFPKYPEQAGEREEAWRSHHGLTGKRLLMYSGTLGMKHDPGLLVDLADAVAGDPSVAVVVISSGPGADWLKSQVTSRGLRNLHVLPFVDYSMISTTLQAAAILLAILEPAAARFSVPSKILTYACAGRPVVVAMPTDNAAARLIRDIGFGTVTPPGDSAAFIGAVRALLEQPQRATDLGLLGRAFAEANFPMQVVEQRFVSALAGLGPL